MYTYICGKPSPGLVVLPDAGGIRPELYGSSCHLIWPKMAYWRVGQESPARRGSLGGFDVGTTHRSLPRARQPHAGPVSGWIQWFASFLASRRRGGQDRRLHTFCGASRRSCSWHSLPDRCLPASRYAPKPVCRSVSPWPRSRRGMSGFLSGRRTARATCLANLSALPHELSTPPPRPRIGVRNGTRTRHPCDATPTAPDAVSKQEWVRQHGSPQPSSDARTEPARRNASTGDPGAAFLPLGIGLGLRRRFSWEAAWTWCNVKYRRGRIELLRRVLHVASTAGQSALELRQLRQPKPARRNAATDDPGAAFLPLAFGASCSSPISAGTAPGWDARWHKEARGARVDGGSAGGSRGSRESASG